MAYPETILTIGDHIAAGLKVTSFCSSGKHSHVLDLQTLANEAGIDRELDYEFALAQRCPDCGAPGGGLKIEQRATD